MRLLLLITAAALLVGAAPPPRSCYSQRHRRRIAGERLEDHPRDDLLVIDLEERRAGRGPARAAVRAGPRRQHPALAAAITGTARRSTGCRTITSRNGAITTATSLFPPGSSASRRPNIRARSRALRSCRSACPIPMRRAPVSPTAGRSPISRRPAGPNLTHCYGSVGVGRDLSPDTGTGGELYAIIGQAPRQLDRNIAVVGRVVEGIDKLARCRAGPRRSASTRTRAQYVPIASIRLASAMPAAERPAYRIYGYGQARPSRAYLHAPRQPPRRFLHPPGGRGRPVQRAGAGAEEGQSAATRPRRGGRGSCAG